ncbi:MAG: cell division protein FtsQ/DivIB [Acidobacteriota bacterium]|nr:cell division protein FtsQ/DivIB [Acidobacteriota bacterium]
MKTVLTQTDRRFRRAQHPARPTRVVARHWLGVVRALVVAGGVAGGGYHVAVLLQAAPFLVVDDIVVRGNDQLSEGEVLALLSRVKGDSILAIDLETQQQRLVASPWLIGGTLRRILPSTVEVVVRERLPVAIARFASRLYLIDTTGSVIEEYGPRFAQFDLPIIDGLIGDTGEPEMVDVGRMALASAFLAQLSGVPDVRETVSQIDVADPHNAIVQLNDDLALLHVGADRFVERLRYYAELAPALRERVADIDYVDLRFDQRVFVKSATSRRARTPTRRQGRVRAVAAGDQ